MRDLSRLRNGEASIGPHGRGDIRRGAGGSGQLSSRSEFSKGGDLSPRLRREGWRDGGGPPHWDSPRDGSWDGRGPDGQTLPDGAYMALFLSLLIGTPVLSLLGSIGVALTVGLGSRGLILAVITLPMSVPVLIAGTLTVQESQNGAPLLAYLAILGAMLLAAISLAPLASAAALRISVN